MPFASQTFSDLNSTLTWRIGRLLGKHEFWMGPWNRKRLERAPRLGWSSCPLLGKSLVLTDPYWFLRSHHEIFVGEIYRFQATRTAPLVIDCGANVGLSVLYFKHHYPDSHIVAFEPDPDIFAVLRRNVTTYALAGVELHRAAVWSSDGTTQFQPDGAVGGRIVARSEHTGIPVRTVRLRPWLSNQVDMLKVDIEGAEAAVLSDCRDLLHNAQHIFVEYHGNANEPQTLDELLLLLRQTGFRYHVKEANPVEHPFISTERGSVFDLQLNIFAFHDGPNPR